MVHVRSAPRQRPPPVGTTWRYSPDRERPVAVRRPRQSPHWRTPPKDSSDHCVCVYAKFQQVDVGSEVGHALDVRRSPWPAAMASAENDPRQILVSCVVHAGVGHVICRQHFGGGTKLFSHFEGSVYLFPPWR